MLNKDIYPVITEIERVTGIDVSMYRPTTLRRRLDLRVSATKSKSYLDYLACLKKDRSEHDKFLQALTINVTDFFRDKGVFQFLQRQVLPDLIHQAEKKKRIRIRICSLGCSKGQEPYSLAILMNEILKARLDDFQIIIHAMDLDKDALAKARQGLYTRSEVKNVPRRYINTYFIKTDGVFKVKEKVRKLVKFDHFDLINGRIPGKFDLILCRNLFIFFQPQLQARILTKMHGALKREGILLLGKSETPSHSNLFCCLFSKYHIYQRIT